MAHGTGTIGGQVSEIILEGVHVAVTTDDTLCMYTHALMYTHTCMYLCICSESERVSETPCRGCAFILGTLAVCLALVRG